MVRVLTFDLAHTELEAEFGAGGQQVVHGGAVHVLVFEAVRLGQTLLHRGQPGLNTKHTVHIFPP